MFKENLIDEYFFQSLDEKEIEKINLMKEDSFIENQNEAIIFVDRYLSLSKTLALTDNSILICKLNL